MASVVFENVTKVFKTANRHVTAVDNFSLEVNDKEFVVILGPSGCGKTTALRIVAGLETPTSGEIYIEGRPVTRLRPRERGAAMVFQDYALYPHMTVYDNLAFGLENFGYKKTRIRDLVSDASKLLGIDDILRSKPSELSGGQRQRVALGRAIVRSPKVFLFDEPLSNIDAKLRVQMRMELAKMKERFGITVIYVTHDQTEAMTLGERLVVMESGSVQQVDSPRKIYHQPRNIFVAGFIGQMNLLTGKLERVGNSLSFTAGELALKTSDRRDYSEYAGRKAVLGIRPEDIRIPEVETAPRMNGGSVVQARVDLVEILGSEACAYFEVGGKSFMARFHSDVPVDARQSYRFMFNMEKAHIFDADTGEALRPREG